MHVFYFFPSSLRLVREIVRCLPFVVVRKEIAKFIFGVTACLTAGILKYCFLLCYSYVESQTGAKLCIGILQSMILGGKKILAAAAVIQSMHMTGRTIRENSTIFPNVTFFTYLLLARDSLGCSLTFLKFPTFFDKQSTRRFSIPIEDLRAHLTRSFQIPSPRTTRELTRC